MGLHLPFTCRRSPNDSQLSLRDGPVQLFYEFDSFSKMLAQVYGISGIKLDHQRSSFIQDKLRTALYNLGLTNKKKNMNGRLPFGR